MRAPAGLGGCCVSGSLSRPESRCRPGLPSAPGAVDGGEPPPSPVVRSLAGPSSSEPRPRAALRPGHVGVSGRRPAPSRRARRGGRGSVPARQASRRLSFWTVVSEAGARHSRQCCSSGTSDSVQPTQRRGRNEAADPAGRIAESRPRRPRTTALPGAPGLGRGGAGTDAHERDLAALLKTVLVLGRVMV